MKRVIFLCVGLVVLILFNVNGYSQSCITSECHTDMEKFRVVHSPVEEDCTACHEEVGKHKFKKITKNIRELCYECHDNKEEGKYLHGGIKIKDCLFCHNPHGGRTKSLLKTKRVDETCYECHDKASKNKKHIHGPNTAGNCSICHDSHSSDNRYLLIESEDKLCIQCHTDKSFSDENERMHTPLEDGCTGCHNPHTSDYEYQLITAPDKICAECHEDIVEHAETAKFKHPIVEQDKKCLNCHDPHGSFYENNMKKDPLSLCLDCHNKPIIGTDGKDYNIYKICKNNPYKHGPVSDGNCSGCHNPHGSSYYKILNNKYPETFYTSFATEKYALCFECHEADLVNVEKTTVQTNFRNGDENLHYFHINRKKGRTCRACHEVHASKLEKHIREETPFGKWDIPIEFEITKTGGSCSPGCHKPYKYDRINPESYK